MALPRKNLGYLIPATIDPPESDCVRIAIPDDPDHRAAFWGAMETLTQWHNWERNDAKTGKEAAAVWTGVVASAHQNFIEGLCEMDCDCIKDFEFDPVTGKLTYVDGQGNTIVIFDNGDTYISSQYVVIKAEEPNADDAYCYAAWMLAERAADDFQDMLEFIDVFEEVTTGAIKQFFASLIDLVPFFGDIAEAIIRIQDNLEEDIFEWVKENARDIEARALAAEIIYCGIKIAMENGGQESIRAGIIQAGTPDLKQFTINKVDGVWTIPDIKQIVQDAFTGLNGALLGYAVVAWLLITDSVLKELGANRPLEAIMAFATKYAAAHDDRDCAGFNCDDWCHVFDFADSDEGWILIQGAGSYSNGAWRSKEFQGNEILRIRLQIGSQPVVKSIRVEYTAAMPANSGNRRVRYATVTPYGDLETGAGDFNTIIYKDVTIVNDIRVEVDTLGSLSGENTITKIEVCGTGNNPWA